MLSAYVTGGYPTNKLGRLVRGLGLNRLQNIANLLDRKERLPDGLVHPMWLSEFMNQLAQFLGRWRILSAFSERLAIFGMRQYGHRASWVLRRCDAQVYHYRSGYGGISIAESKTKQMIALCDHSIAHPSVLEYLIDNDGRMPARGHIKPPTRFWQNVLDDIDRADHIIVNSDFVKETFLSQGYPSDRIHVAYVGVDQQFMNAIPARDFGLERQASARLLFAGQFGRRKGADALVAALSRIDQLPWTLEVIGSIDPDMKSKHASFLSDRRVSLLGSVPRLELAKRMSNADVFIFPSLAEGSARVVFMAMACGCYIITTPNSGSVVADRVNGALVPVGDVDALERAIREVLADMTLVKPVGPRNAQLIKDKYQQAHYGSTLAGIYRRCIHAQAQSPRPAETPRPANQNR